MLVLSRRQNEEIVIDGGIRITVLSVDGNRVRIGVTAPSSVKVHRSEILQRVIQTTAVAELTGALSE